MSQPPVTPDTDTNVLESIKLSRIVVPSLLGLGVVLWLMSQQLDVQEFKTISWNSHNLIWLLAAVGCYVVRHLFYSWRLRELSGRLFSWWKSVELIFIWEFASSVSPTSVGGSAVALFMLAQEKISTARTVSIVLYSLVADSLFFVVSLIVFYTMIGPSIIRPDMETFADLDRFGFIFFAVVIFMALYGGLFFYGLFIRPTRLRMMLKWLSKRKLLSRFSATLSQTGDDVIRTARELRVQTAAFHIRVFVATAGAWLMRFAALNCIIIAIIPTTSLDALTQLEILARGETMYAVTAFSPTPGGAGVAEVMFGGFFTDYISPGIATIVALIWRLITYYPYLIAGAFIIPNWIRKILAYRRERTRDLG